MSETNSFITTSESCEVQHLLILGPTGSVGQIGPKGKQGVDGQDGLPGPQGDPGEPGCPGLQGKKGDRGDTGVTGEQGDTGAAGGDTCKLFPDQDSILVGDIVTFGKDNAGNPELHKLIVEQWHWNASIDSSQNDLFPTIITDDCGNIYIAGFTVSGVLNTPGFYNAGNVGAIADISGITTSSQLYVGKMNQYGQWLWVASIDRVGPQNKKLNLALDSCGNIYACSYSTNESGPQFFNADGTVTILGRNANPTSTIQSFVAKLNPDGIWQWAAAIDTTPANQSGTISPAITADTCGNIYVVAETAPSSTIPQFYSADPTTGNTESVVSLQGIVAGDRSFCMGKLDRNGQWIWAAQINVNPIVQNDETIRNPRVATDKYGNAYITAFGAIRSIPEFYGPDSTGNVDPTIVLTGRTGGENTQVIVAKIDPLGKWIWAASIDTPLGNDFEPDIATNSCGSSIVVGTMDTNVGSTGPLFYGATGPDGNTDTIPSLVGIPDQQIFVGKIDTNGKWQWTAAITNSVNLIIGQATVALDGCGNAYIGGSAVANGTPGYHNTLSNGNTNLNVAVNGITTTSRQITFGKISSEGEWQWAAAIDSSSDEASPSIHVDNCGAIYIAGAGSTNTAPNFYDAVGPTGNTNPTSSMTGRVGVLTQIFIGKMPNEARSACAIGVVREVDGDDVTACFFNSVDTTDVLIPGNKYYIKTNNPLGTSLLTTDACNSCGCPNRIVGTAISENQMLWNVKNKLCDDNECCCCITEIFEERRPNPTPSPE